MPEAPFHLDPHVAGALRARIPATAEQVIAAIMAEVPSYADPFRGRMGATIERAVQVALDGFLELAASPVSAGRRTREDQVRDAAFALGRGEARAGRTIDALTTAYGVGARVAWHDIGAGAIDAGLGSTEVARFAELVFAFINELSVQSITGHAAELASTGAIRQRRLERLCQKLLDGAPHEDLLAAAALAGWEPPARLLAVILEDAEAGGLTLALGSRVLSPGEEVAGLGPGMTVLLVPVPDGGDRTNLLARLGPTSAVVGPARPWIEAAASFLRARQSLAIDRSAATGPWDTDEHLLELVLAADPDALCDLRARALAPLDPLSETAREKLITTLRAWLLHHGRRDDIARSLFIHPQTVRYRMTQLRELYGEALSDPRRVLELTVALAFPAPAPALSG